MRSDRSVVFVVDDDVRMREALSCLRGIDDRHNSEHAARAAEGDLRPGPLSELPS
jgi:hypothetical protein